MRHLSRLRAALGVPALLVVLSAGGAGASSPRIEQPEVAFGRTIGDVLTQRVRLLDGETIEEGTLPEAGRVDVWFTRLSADVVGERGGERHVELRYQIVNSPTEAIVASLPVTELTLAGRLGTPPDGNATEAGRSGAEPAGAAASVVTLAVPPWPVAIAPLLPGTYAIGSSGTGRALADAALPAMRPDRLLPPLDTEAHRERARVAATALALALVAWALWWAWRARRDTVRLPFSRARAELGRLPHARREEDARAWRAAHAALNATAGQVSGPATLDVLLRRAPWLAPYRERLLAFHDASAGRFFEQPPRREPFALQAFVRDLERAERRQAG